jgi:hypothetical protein
MSPQEEQLTDFEHRARTVLEASVTRVDGRIRSRLNQARQAALEEAQRRSRPSFRSRLSLMPAVGAVAAVLLVVMVLWYRPPRVESPPVASDTMRSSVEDLDMLADGEGFDLIQTGDGSFYEWAMAQADGDTTGTGI